MQAHEENLKDLQDDLNYCVEQLSCPGENPKLLHQPPRGMLRGKAWGAGMGEIAAIADVMRSGFDRMRTAHDRLIEQTEEALSRAFVIHGGMTKGLSLEERQSYKRISPCRPWRVVLADEDFHRLEPLHTQVSKGVSPGDGMRVAKIPQPKSMWVVRRLVRGTRGRLKFQYQYAQLEGWVKGEDCDRPTDGQIAPELHAGPATWGDLYRDAKWVPYLRFTDGKT